MAPTVTLEVALTAIRTAFPMEADMVVRPTVTVRGEATVEEEEEALAAQVATRCRI